ncbi:ATP binding microtubule motor family protein [Abeliophyllum distichum]
MSDKALVKQLQKEVARLETELRAPGPTCDHAVLLRKKDMQIQKLEKEVRELTKQQDLAHSRIEDLLKMVGNDKTSKELNGIQVHNRDIRSNGMSNLPLSENSVDRSSSDSISDMNEGIEEPSVRTVEDSDDMCKEVRCIEMTESGQDITFESPGWSTNQNEGRISALSDTDNGHDVDQELSPTLPGQASGIHNGHTYGALEQKIQDVQKTIDLLVKPYPDKLSPGASSSIRVTAPGRLKLTRSWSCRDNLVTNSSDFDMAEQSETTPPTGLEKSFPGRPEGFQRKHWKLPPSIYGANAARLSRNDSQSSNCSSFIDEIKTQNSIQGDEDIPTLGSFVAGLKEMAKLQYEQLGDQVQEKEQRGEKNDHNLGLDTMHNSLGASSDWSLKFEKLRKLIIELWQACNVPLVHRTYFFLLFKGDFTDSIYIEVEHRRLSFLKETFSNGNPSVQNGRTFSLASSKKALRREREMLSRLVYKRYTDNERNRIFQEWGISLNSKRRRLQLVHQLWSDVKDMDHITKSAAIVAKLIGFLEQGQALKEMFGLSFTPTRSSRRLFSWKNSMASLM